MGFSKCVDSDTIWVSRDEADFTQLHSPMIDFVVVVGGGGG